MITAKEFVMGYCQRTGMTEKEFYADYVVMPDTASPHGWAAVCNTPLCIKSHVDLYMPVPNWTGIKNSLNAYGGDAAEVDNAIKAAGGTMEGE